MELLLCYAIPQGDVNGLAHRLLERFGSLAGVLDALPEALEQLRRRFAETRSIPHEIGVFLGYPLGDVLGFIANRGRNSVRTGYWQVYCDEAQAAEKFARYRKCHEVYSRLFSAGTA